MIATISRMPLTADDHRMNAEWRRKRILWRSLGPEPAQPSVPLEVKPWPDDGEFGKRSTDFFDRTTRVHQGR